MYKFLYLYPRSWSHGRSKHIGVLYIYKLFFIYLCTLVCTVIVYKLQRFLLLSLASLLITFLLNKINPCTICDPASSNARTRFLLIVC